MVFNVTAVVYAVNTLSIFSVRKNYIPPSENIPAIPQQDFRITFKYFNYCILGLIHRKYILTVTGYNNQIRTM